MANWTAESSVQPNGSQSQSLSIAEMVAQTASEIVTEQLLPGYTYYSEYNAYYNQESGYFYDPNSSLFYHPNTQCYYVYNEQIGQYEIYGQNGPEHQAVNWTKKSFKRRAENLLGQHFIQNAIQEDVEITELMLDLVDRCSFLAGDSNNKNKRKSANEAPQIWDQENGVCFSNSMKQMQQETGNASSSEEEQSLLEKREWIEQEMARRAAEEEIAQNAPCIRLIQRPQNQLHIVTILGATIGFGEFVEIGLDGKVENADLLEGPLLVIRYSEDEAAKQYQLEVSPLNLLELQLNGETIKPNSKYALNHEDLLSIGTCVSFHFHIHNGLNTCQGCEPGLFHQPEIENNKVKKYSKNAERRRQMRAIKEQYGLLDEENSPLDELRTKYVDRAKKRRKLMGSEPAKGMNPAGGIYTGCIAAPVPGCSTDSVQLSTATQSKPKGGMEPIEQSNKGFQMLQAMGWNKGQGLGKNNQGIQGPIETVLKNDRTGLGMPSTSSSSSSSNRSKISIKISERQEILERTRQRYEQIESQQKDKK